MKTKHCIFLLCLLVNFFIIQYGYGQIRVANSGYVGVGIANPQAPLHVLSTGGDWNQAITIQVPNRNSVGVCVSQTSGAYKGDGFYVVGSGWIYSSGHYLGSDSNLKTNMATISNPITKILAFRGITFNWKPVTRSYVTDSTSIPPDTSSSDSGFANLDSFGSTARSSFDTLPHYGFVAQEVEDSFPNSGIAMQMPTGIHAVAYTEVIPILVEAVKAQQAEIASISESYSSCGSKSNFEPGGCAEFTKGDVLNVTARYMEPISDPSSDATREWLTTSDNKSLKYWDNQSTPVKQTVEIQSNKNVASGYAGLDGSSKLTGSQQVYGTATNTACQGNDSRLSDSRMGKLNYYDNTTHTVSSTTSEEVLAYTIIPANTLGTNDIIEVTASGSSNSSGGTKTFRLRLNSSNSIGGTTVATQNLSGTSVGFSGYCRIVEKNSVSSQEVNGPNSGFMAGGLSITASVTSSLNITSDIYLIFTGQKSSSGDTESLMNYQIKILKP